MKGGYHELKYKVLIKYTSKLQKVFYYFYVDQDTGEEFATADLDQLNATVKALDRIYGHENIRTVVDVEYNVNVLVNQDSIFEVVTDDEVMDIYNAAFNKVFGEEGAK